MPIATASRDAPDRTSSTRQRLPPQPAGLPRPRPALERGGGGGGLRKRGQRLEAGVADAIASLLLYVVAAP